MATVIIVPDHEESGLLHRSFGAQQPPCTVAEKRTALCFAVVRDWKALAHASQEVRDDREIIEKAVQSHWEALQYASEKLRGNRDFILQVASREWAALGFATQELKQDRDFILSVVSNNWLTLAHAAKHLRDDREIITRAVAQHWEALRYASERLRADRAVVMMALAHSGKALEFAADELLEDTAFVAAAAAVMPPSLVILKITMISGRFCYLVVDTERGEDRSPTDKQMVLRRCAFKLGIAPSTVASAELLLGDMPVPEGDVSEWGGLRSAEVNDLQIVLLS
mmetsp:Transcript_54305/g.129411  ORF Transcript_54305/g.129411 Transcript_54305/m.129411 type:complete len:283 (+) Transcript_54305:91-939(+)|eukprot:CAMPEP_0178427822 /NCGR_PEP_ID=MMETSP0689_2-20121128/29944_1 /TAXON_ID=160604 /ORGANISM="Amphidinium massartii, Strain CS-259" /LENGTH=282 /DNA_ID=CAMNT_0020049543 /DNA_START=22 /DNA_END=870 /DNA_ORIENTATION=+